MWRTRWGGPLLAVTAAVVVVTGLVLMAWDWSTPLPGSSFGPRGSDGLLAVAFGAVGALLTRRRPDHLVGWILAIAGLLFAVDFAAFEYGLTATAGRRLPGTAYAGWVDMWLWVPMLAVPTVYLFLLFPSGRLPAPRWRLTCWLAAGFTLAAAAGVATGPGGEGPDLPGLRNPFAVAPAPEAFTVGVAGLAGLGGCAVLAAWSLFTRARRGAALERQQVRWLASSACLVAVAAVPAVSLSLSPGIPARIAAGALIAAMLTVPVAVAVAVLRYRLYDLDIVVRKTVTAALVAGVFTAIYAFGVGGIGALIGQTGSGLLTFAAAALAAAALQPVRARAGLLASRVVYGRRATPYEVLTEFSGQVAGSYSVDDVLPRLARMLGEATGAQSAEVWIRAGTTEHLAAAWPADGTPAGEPNGSASDRAGVFEVAHQGDRLGSLRLTTSRQEPLTPAAERLVQAVAGQAGLVLRNVGLVEDLRSSRQRLVSAADEARRRLERDLHDGAQQQLIALRITVGLAREAMRDPSGEAEELLSNVEQAAGAALAELRNLAHGIYPPLLTSDGLAAALTAHARRATVPVTVDADGTGRYGQEVEAAIYFAVCEALTNVAKYAQAKAARVTLRPVGRHLTFTVEDDGKGMDTTTTPAGSGVQGMTDRMVALGGTLDISSAPGRGTTVTGQVPVRELAAASGQARCGGVVTSPPRRQVLR